MIRFKKTTLAISLASIFVAVACGGGSGTTAAPLAAPTISGVAATGLPIANATITVTDATGKTVSVTADANGAYSVDVTGLTAPFVITASGTVGDSTVVLNSVLPTAPAAGATSTANVTPLTNAIATYLSSTKNPDDLASGIATQKANITDSAVAAVTSYLQKALGPLATNAGASATFDPISSQFNANGTGLDKLLDNITITIQPGTGATITLKGAATIDDMAANAAATPLPANSSISLSAATTLSTPPTVPTVTINDYGVADAAQAALNTCFAVASAQRPTATQCTSLVAPDYLNNGRNIGQEFSPLMTAAFDNATIDKPEIIRFYSPTRAQVKVSGTRTDGQQFNFTTVVAKVTVTGTTSAESATGTWMMRGNQRAYWMFVNAVAEKRDELNANASVPSGYSSGLNLYFDLLDGNGAALPVFANAGTYVKVTGPGLPAAGVILKKSIGTCGYLTIVSESGDTAKTKNNCASYFRLTGTAQDATKSAAYDAQFDSTNTAVHGPQFAAGKASDASIMAINAFDAYTFTLHDGTNSTDTTFIERLRSRPLALTEVPKVHWNVLSANTKALLDPASATAFTGGSSINVSWTPQPNTAPTSVLNVQFKNNGTLVATNPGVSPKVSSSAVAAPTGTSFPAAGNGTSSKDFDYISLNSRNKEDMQIFSATSYTAY